MSFFDEELHQKVNGCLGTFESVKHWILSKKIDYIHQDKLYGYILCPITPPPSNSINEERQSTTPRPKVMRQESTPTEKICRKLNNKIVNGDKKNFSPLPKIAVDKVAYKLTVSTNNVPLPVDSEPKSVTKSIMDNFKKMSFPSLITPLKDDPYGSAESTVNVEKDCIKNNAKIQIQSDAVVLPTDLKESTKPIVVVDECKLINTVYSKNIGMNKKLSKIDVTLETLRFTSSSKKKSDSKSAVTVDEKIELKEEEIKSENELFPEEVNIKSEEECFSTRPKMLRITAPADQKLNLPSLEYVKGAPRLLCRLPLTLIRQLPEKPTNADVNKTCTVSETKYYDVNKTSPVAEMIPLCSLPSSSYDVNKISPAVETLSLGSSSNVKDISSSSTSTNDEFVDPTLNDLIADYIKNESYDMPIFDFGPSSGFIEPAWNNNSDNESNFLSSDRGNILNTTSKPKMAEPIPNVLNGKEDDNETRPNLKRKLSIDCDVQLTDDKRLKLACDEMNAKFLSLAPLRSFPLDRSIVDGNCYLLMASKLARSAKNKDPMTRIIERLESAVYCYLSGFLVEKQLGRPYNIYRLAIDKLTLQSNFFAEEKQINLAYVNFMIRKLRFFSTVLQSLLSFRLYAPYQKSVQRNFEYLYDTTMKTRKICSNEQKTDNSERYEISINGRPNFVAIPSDLELVYKKQINRMHCLVLAHRCWEEAENRRSPKDSEFYIQLDRICGRLSLTMDVHLAFVHILTALNWLKKFHHEFNKCTL